MPAWNGSCTCISHADSRSRPEQRVSFWDMRDCWMSHVLRCVVRWSGGRAPRWRRHASRIEPLFHAALVPMSLRARRCARTSAACIFLFAFKSVVRLLGGWRLSAIGVGAGLRVWWPVANILDLACVYWLYARIYVYVYCTHSCWSVTVPQVDRGTSGRNHGTKSCFGEVWLFSPNESNHMQNPQIATTTRQKASMAMPNIRLPGT